MTEQPHMDHDDIEHMLDVREMVLALMQLPGDAPVVIIDSTREVPIPYRVGVGWAISTDGMSMPVFTILVGDVAAVAESGTILFGSTDERSDPASS